MTRLSALLRMSVSTASEEARGRVHDVVGRIDGDRLVVTGLVVGPLGLLERYGLRTAGRGGPDAPRTHGHDTAEWGSVVRVDDGIVLRDDS